jgi:intracellular septation protein
MVLQEPSLGATGELAMIRAPAFGRPGRSPRSSMQFVVDLLPVIAFFIAYKLAGIYIATAVLIVGVLVQTLVSWIRFRKVSPMLLTTAGLVLLFGGLTLYLHDATFIKWKPTIVNWLFAVVFLASHFVRGPTVIQRMLGENVTLAAADWTWLSVAWVAFFVLSGGLNLYVAYNYPEATWVNFKLFGLMGLTLLFAVAQGFWIARRADQAEAEKT